MTIRNLTCAELESRLGDYLEGTLDDAAAADVELHLSGCAACAGMVRDLETIVREAATLPALAPSRDLWPAIEARLTARPDAAAPVHGASRDRSRDAGAAVVDLTARAAARRQVHRQLHRFAPSRRLRIGALAAGLVGITAVTTWFASRQLPAPSVASAPERTVAPERDSAAPRAVSIAPSETPSASAAGATATRGGTTSASNTAAPVVTTTLRQEITALRGVLTERRDELDPRTIAVLETSLATIDSAITEARRALQADPASRFLSSQLDKALEKKLGLLRTAALLPART